MKFVLNPLSPHGVSVVEHHQTVVTVPGGGGAHISDEAYGASWDGVTTVAPSKNAVYDKMEVLQAKVSIVVGTNGDLGYITDGVDDQVQINQAMIDVSAAGGGTVWVPDTEYSINEELIPQNYVWLRGSGMFSTMLKGTATISTAIIGTDIDAALEFADFSNPLTDFTYSDLTIDGSETLFTGRQIADTFVKGCEVSNTLRLRVQNVRVQNTVASGFGNDFPEQALYDNCIAINCGREAFDPGYNGFGIGLGKPNESLQMVNCYAFDCGNNGFLFEKQFSIIFETSPRNYLLTNCYAVNCRRGFRDSAGSGMTLVNCKAIGNETFGYNFVSGGQFSVPYDIILDGCEAYENGGDGVNFEADSRIANAILTGIRSFSNQGDGIQLGGTRAIMDDVICFNNRDCGIQVAPSAWPQYQVPVKAVKISNATCANNGQDNTNGNAYGIKISGTTERIDSVTLDNVTCYDDQATPSQFIGIHIVDNVSKVTLDTITCYGHYQNGINIDISGYVVNDYHLDNIKAYNNCRETTTSPFDRGVHINADTTTGGYLDKLSISNLHAYDDQLSLMPQKATVAIYTQPTAVAGNLNGAYTYKITWVNAIGETKGGVTSGVVNPVNNQVKVTYLPVGPDGTTARKIYRTVAGGADGTQKLVATVSDNTTTTYVDNVADGSLGATVPTVNTDGTTNTPFVPSVAIYEPDTAVAGNLTGTYRYKVTYVTALGETAGGYTSTVSGLSSNQVKVYIPLGPDGTTARKLYRTASGGADGTQKLVTTINDNDPDAATYLYIDNIVDGSLGAAVPTSSTAYAATQLYGLSLTGNITNALVHDGDVLNNVTAGIVTNSTFDNSLTNVIMNMKGWNSEESYSLGNITGAVTLNRINGQTQYGTLTGNITVTMTAGKRDGDVIRFVLTQDATGSRTATWPSNCINFPTLSTAANAVDVISAVWDSATSKWRATSIGNISGPTSATDNAVVRFDGTTGKLVQNSAVTIADTGAQTMNVSTTLGTSLAITNTGASSSSNGVGFLNLSNDGAALASGDRIGFVLFGGAYDASNNTHNASGVTFFTTEAWSSTNRGSDLRFEVTANATASRVVAGRFGNDSKLYFGTGTDTNLYRSAADTLKTDDNLIVAAAGTAANSVASIDATQTLTNKRVTPRVVTTADDATAVIDVDVTDQYQLTAMANATTISTTGTPTAGQKLLIRLKDNGTGRALTWDSVFRAIGVTLPTTTVANKTHYIGCVYNSTDSKFDVLAVGAEA